LTKKSFKKLKGGRIHCRSSSHGRPASSQTRRPSIEEGGQSIPVVGCLFKLKRFIKYEVNKIPEFFELRFC